MILFYFLYDHFIFIIDERGICMNFCLAEHLLTTISTPDRCCMTSTQTFLDICKCCSVIPFSSIFFSLSLFSDSNFCFWKKQNKKKEQKKRHSGFDMMI